MTDILVLTAGIVSAHVSHNPIGSAELPDLIQQVHGALVHAAAAPEEPEPVKPEPAVSIQESMTPDRLVCLHCGNGQKLLKRHLRTAHDISPDEYRTMFDLPADYPMAAPNYAQLRSEMAKKNGLGTKRGGVT